MCSIGGLFGFDLGSYLGFMWVLFGFYLRSVWVLCVFYLGLIWIRCGVYLVLCVLYVGFCMGPVWVLFGSI